MMKTLYEPRTFFALLLIAAMGILGTALASQYFGGLQPCPLCLWQRYPYVVVIGLAGIGFGLSGNATLAARATVLPTIAFLAALALYVDAGIAAFHVGVEQHWWEGLQSCSAAPISGSIEALGAQLLGTPIVRCDEVAWSLGGISMAGYNFITALGLGVITTRAAQVMKANHGG
jgi:disulfide bond formation protein DsbB